MSYDTFTIGLNTAEFPFISDFFQRSITLPGIDTPPRVPKSDTGTFESKNPELGQHYYAQNVVPSVEGLMSVGFKQIVEAVTPAATDFDQVIILRDVDENNFLFSPSGGKNYIYTALSGAWVSNNPFIATPGSLVTRGYVNGRTFVCYEGQNVFEYNTGAGTFDSIPLVGLSAVPDGISASNNYLIAWIGIEVHWSSLTDPTDLTPSIFTGAGFATPQDVRGPIINVVPVSGGFIIYTTKNAVAALYTNNSRAPFVFKEISNTGGITDPEQVTLEATVGFHYAWTSSGLQKITANTSEAVSGAATDFLAGRIFESFDSINNILTTERLTTNLHVKVAYVSGRYLIVSYGKDTGISVIVNTHALIFDTVLKRWGKLMVDHVDCFTYPYPNLPGEVTSSPPKQSMAFLQADGTIILCVLDYRDQQDQGVLLLGRYQLVRQKLVTFQNIEFESLVQAYPPEVYMLLSADGRNNQTAIPLSILGNSGNYRKYGAPTYSGSGAAPARTGKNISFLMKGTFELSAGVLTVTRHGNR